MNKWMEIPGWACPSPENKLRCERFKKDRFAYNDIENGLRYYQNTSGRDALPLIVFLHGADAVGTDNESQIALHDVGTVFADPAWQAKNPCHIVAPQYAKGRHWALPRMTEYVYELTMHYAEQFHADMSRLYVYGYSAGAIGIFSLLKQHPIYAAAVPICGATEAAELEKLLQTPLWLYHAEDDGMVSPNSFEIVYYKEPYIGSAIIYEKMRRLGHTDIRFTCIPAGEMKEKHHLHPHCSWVLMGEDEEVKNWLFRHRAHRSD